MAAAVAGRAWPVAGVWPGHTLDVWTGRLRAWGALELERGRAFLMLPVAMGAGILLYFAAPDEPTVAAPLALLALLCLVALRLRERYAAFLVMAALAAMTVGFAAATLKTHWMKHPILAGETGVVRVEAWVEAVEKREGNDRLTLHVIAINPAPERMPQRIRVTSRTRSAVAVGQPVTLTARLRPPADPAAPGHYDFGRDAYFMGLGASGFVIGAITFGAASATGDPPWPVQLRARLDSVRNAISTRIRAAIPGPAGAIADALVTGKRDGIPEGINEAMRAAGTYHILSISGFHMALVAALIFAVVRGGLALVPSLALTRHVKAWAALVALLVSTAYLVISGAEVATQRSWIMIAVVLVGVALDRGALTLRTLALAAIAVLVIAPDSLLGPSFQMSFAATLALIAGYVTLRPWAERHSGDPAGWGRSLLIVTNGVIGLATSSFVASVATTPYAAFHFNTVHLYGVAGNLLGAPIIEFFVMPLQILALLLWPFGWDKPVWALAGLGIELFVRSGEWVASWPGGRVIVPSLHPTGLLTLSVGFIILGLFSTPLRWLGLPAVALGLLIAPDGQRPLLLVDGEGATVAARAPDGTLRVVSARGNRFAVQRWLIGEADRRSATDETLQEGVRCDPLGCAMPLAGGGRIAVPRHPDALPDDCREARIVVTRNDPPPGCAAIVIDLRAIAWTGALRIHADPSGLRVEPARPAGADRPWFRPRPPGLAPPVLRLPGRTEAAAAAGRTTEAEPSPDLEDVALEPAQ
ncbi:MAG: ComEC family competence protein [Phreatobacter sp.]|nr:ComEC family competence protein [Phreatobacter sp.]